MLCSSISTFVVLVLFLPLLVLTTMLATSTCKQLESVHVVVAGSTDPFEDDTVDCVLAVTPPRVNAEKTR